MNLARTNLPLAKAVRCIYHLAAFTIEDLGNQIEESLGFPAKVVFCVGLYAAAYSSALTCPLVSGAVSTICFAKSLLLR